MGDSQPDSDVVGTVRHQKRNNFAGCNVLIECPVRVVIGPVDKRTVGQLFAFAGIWDRWSDREGNTVETCSILTTSANALTSTVHDRMPVILDKNNYDLWLDPGMRTVAVVSELLKPLDARLMRCYPVKTRINQVNNDDAECSAPIDLIQVQNSLFL